MSEKEIIANELGGVQGDVPLLRIDALTEGGKATEERIVAYGETTGHHHKLLGECQVFEVVRNIENEFFPGLEVVVAEDNPVELWHKSDGDHDSIVMPPGFYFIPTEVQQVEYDGESERRVYD